ncbi:MULTISPECIES: hypothetical protein [Oceanobacillus]|uniref:hypothetical protein n=1 Tax=Oceanobacillus TaxID=182709 RepID=UPI002116D53B|nr:hypothetical protein [Oceanobacillus oncorhynchi]UUI41306.1 hypothetical protein NP440_07075 [Oceanobacillus oncorhynchi]
MVFFITGLANGLSLADSSSLLNLEADHAVIDSEEKGQIVISELTEDQVEDISNELNGGTSPLDMTFAQLEIDGEQNLDVMYFSVDTDKHPNMEILEGKNIRELTVNETIVNNSLKDQMYQLGDKIINEHSGNTLMIACFIEGSEETIDGFVTLNRDELVQSLEQ